MNEQFVTLDVARLAKEKGFNMPVNNFYYGDGFLDNGDGDCEWICLNHNEYDTLYSAPTQTLLQNWLREKKFYHIYAMPVTGNKWVYNVKYISLVIGDFIPCLLIDQEYNTYEEALEHGLIEALKLI